MRIILFILLFCGSFQLFAQMGPNSGELTPQEKETQPKAPEKIDIKPTARDHEIRDRLQAILEATGWFESPQVQVKEGVVFLNGEVKSEEFKKWAGNLARNTQDVSAVVNKITISQPSIWDFKPVMSGLEELWRDVIRVLPSLLFAFFILALTWLIARLVTSVSRKILKKKLPSQLLLDVVARTFGFVVFVFGFYIIFKMMGLTTVALTILGGTGALGIILGIAFRDITENLLASIFLSIHHPFRNGDLVEIAGVQGYIQRLTIRSTVMMSLEGNHVQIPNATVYRSNIRNFSVNPNRSESFMIAIGFSEDIPKAQDIALQVLADHPAVLKDPEPWVLVDNVEKASVNLKVYFWLDGSKHSWLKVRSSVIRLIKRALQKEKIVLPGDTHEIIFRSDLPVNLLEKTPTPKEKPPTEPAPVATSAEGDLRSEVEEIKEQARQSRSPEKGEENLLNKNQKHD